MKAGPTICIGIANWNRRPLLRCACFEGRPHTKHATRKHQCAAGHLSMTSKQKPAGPIAEPHTGFCLKRRQASLVRKQTNTEHLLLRLGFGEFFSFASGAPALGRQRDPPSLACSLENNGGEKTPLRCARGCTEVLYVLAPASDGNARKSALNLPVHSLSLPKIHSGSKDQNPHFKGRRGKYFHFWRHGRIPWQAREVAINR